MSERERGHRTFVRIKHMTLTYDQHALVQVDNDGCLDNKDSAVADRHKSEGGVGVCVVHVRHRLPLVVLL